MRDLKENIKNLWTHNLHEWSHKYKVVKLTALYSVFFTLPPSLSLLLRTSSFVFFSLPNQTQFFFFSFDTRSRENLFRLASTVWILLKPCYLYLYLSSLPFMILLLLNLDYIILSMIIVPFITRWYYYDFIITSIIFNWIQDHCILFLEDGQISFAVSRKFSGIVFCLYY